jgi:O-antigen ligase
MIADHPVFGVGPDQFLNQFQAKYITPEQEKERYTAHPHNIFLDYWLTLGIMGLLILLWLLWRYFREAVGTARRLAREPDPDPVGRAMALGLLALMVDFLVHGLVDNSYFLMDLAMIFWLSCGLLQSINALRQAPEPAGNSR